jgi:hypothetical protein
MTVLIALGLIVPLLNSGQAADETLNNDLVIELVKLGLGESLVIDKINASKCNFDVSISGIKALKSANVPDSVISAMLSASKGAASSQAAASQTADVADPDDPKTPRDAGIYYFQEADGKAKLTKLEPSVYTQQKTGKAIFERFGQSVKQRALINSANAMLRASDARPVFYFYFENTKSGLGETMNAATSPNEFVLAQFERRDNQRSLIVGLDNAYTGSEIGPEAKAIRPFDFEKIAPGIFKVRPKSDLASGEYGFFSGGFGMAGSKRVFDFGVEGSPDTEPDRKSKTKAPKN